MNTYIYWTLLVLLPLLIYGCSTSRTTLAKTKVVDNRCYDLLKKDILLDIRSYGYPIYTGTDDDIETETVHLDSQQKWVRQLKSGSCISANPDDCMVWCLKGIPTMSIDNVVVDTSTTSEISWEDLNPAAITTSNTLEWFEVVCPDKVSSSIIYDICVELSIETNNSCKEGEDYLSNDLKKHLISYQMENYLPIGSINVETLEHMGIAY